jgi:hypothetical protein
MTGRYGLMVMRMLRVAGVATVLAIALVITILLRQEKRAALEAQVSRRL